MMVRIFESLVENLSSTYTSKLKVAILLLIIGLKEFLCFPDVSLHQQIREIDPNGVEVGLSNNNQIST
jgi:hypothetical protein